VSTAVPLARLEQLIDRSQAAGRIEALLPVGVRRRQLKVRTLLAGMMLTQADHRPAHLSRVHQALTSLPETERIRPGVVAGWKHGPHVLTYRQVERTFHLVVCALEKEHPDGAPSAVLAATLDALLEASIPPGQKNTTRALAVDWSDLETFSCPPPAKGGDCADPEASRGHRRGNSPGQKDELFYGYYISAATIVREENGPAVPELARRMTLTSCHLDPAPAMVPVLECLPGSGVPLGDIPGDSGYAHRAPENWAVPLRAAGARLIQDLHPHDRGPKGTYAGATILGDGRVALILDVRALARRAHVVRDGESAHDRGKNATNTGALDGPESLLIVTVGERRLAIPLSMLTRLEEIATDRVERVGQHEVVQYRGQLLPLSRLSTMLGEPVAADPETLKVIVYTQGRRSVGLVVDAVVDIATEEPRSRADVSAFGISGVVVVQDLVTELLDMEQAIMAADARFFDAVAAAGAADVSPYEDYADDTYAETRS